MELITDVYDFIARNPDRFFDLVLAHVRLSFTSLAIAALIYLPLGTLFASLPRFGGQLVGLFSSIRVIPSLALVFLFYPFLGINFVLNGVVRAAGAMYPVLVLNVISFWVLRYPLTYMFAEWLGESGIAVGMGTSFIISSVVAFGYFRFGRWRNRQLFAEPAPK